MFIQLSTCKWYMDHTRIIRYGILWFWKMGILWLMLCIKNNTIFNWIWTIFFNSIRIYYKIEVDSVFESRTTHITALMKTAEEHVQCHSNYVSLFYKVLVMMYSILSCNEHWLLKTYKPKRISTVVTNDQMISSLYMALSPGTKHDYSLKQHGRYR